MERKISNAGWIWNFVAKEDVHDLWLKLSLPTENKRSDITIKTDGAYQIEKNDKQAIIKVEKMHAGDNISVIYQENVKPA